MGATAIIVVAALHVVFFAMESIFWTTPAVRRAFLNSAEQAQETRVLALNQGAYNLGLAVLLTWLYFRGDQTSALGVLVYIVSMGVVGACSANWRILVVQSAPAAVAFGVVWFGL